MLRSIRSKSDASRPFVCRRCLSSLRSSSSKRLWPSASSKVLRQLSLRHQNGTTVLLTSKRSFSAYTTQRFDTVPNLSPLPTSQQHPLPLDTQQIRLQTIERLRQWEVENASSFVKTPELNDNRPSGELRNSWTRRGNEEFMVDPNLDDMNENLNRNMFSRDDLLDIGNDRQFLRRGDLVELLSMQGVDRELGIYLGEFDTQSQFYSMSGGWVHRLSRVVLFSVPGFVEPHELDELRPYLPASDVQVPIVNKLHAVSQFIPRSVGEPLIRKMMDFWTQANLAYQAHSAKLDTAHAQVAHPTRFKYASLNEIASDLLPEVVKKSEDYKLPYPVLYAVHRSLLTDGVGFKPPFRSNLRGGGQYEIMPAIDMTDIKLVRDIVREHTDSKFAGISDSRPRFIPRGQIRLDQFVAKARRRIDISRKSRQFTRHGTIGPVFTELDDMGHAKLGQLIDDFNQTDMKIALFLESWSALQSFTGFSPMNGIGSAILRAVGRYDEETDLDQKTAWTFLQEIGAIAPWESRTAYNIKLPNTGLRLSRQPSCSSVGFVPDKLKDIRKDWGDLPVYCIDSSDTLQIDDGISIEPTDTPGQYWLHVHVADPASHIDPTSAVAQYAEELVETVYMPNRVVPMLLPSFVQANLSLAPDRPCLTYSAKLNTDGELLDYKVTAGIIHNVRLVTPSVLGESVLKLPFSKRNKFYLVGPDMPRSENRRMVQGNELSDVDKENFRVLHGIWKVHTKRSLMKGAVFNNRKSFSVSVSIKGSLPGKKVPSATCHNDPSIQIFTEEVDNSVDSSVEVSAEDTGSSIVKSTMLIAGEVAARWCKDRGIPVIYRVTPRNDDKEDPSEFFAKNVLPTINEKGDFDTAQTQAFLKLLDFVHRSTTPGPHVTMGLDMFTRSTSPLRRYTDLLLGWQVGSALLEEARIGQSLVGSTNHDFLPKTKAQIDSFLPYLHAKERLIIYGKGQVKKHWLFHFLLRAWKFGEVDIPRKYSFVIWNVENHDHRKGLLGTIDHFPIDAMCHIPEWSTLEEFKIGDILEVEISDLNLYDLTMQVEAIRRLDASEKEALDKENLSKMQSQEII